MLSNFWKMNKIKKMKNGPGDDLKFHYNREERLKKLRRVYEDTGKRKRLFTRRKNRILLIFLVDLIIISAVGYFLTKPANIYIKEKRGEFQYELNVTGIRGNKVMVGFTMKYLGEDKVIFSSPEEVIVLIKDNDGKKYIEEKKNLQSGMILQKGESSSLVFLFEQNDLPTRGRLELFYKDVSVPFFSKDVRF